MYDPGKAHHPGSTVPIKVAVLDHHGANASSSSLNIVPVRLTRTGDSTAFTIEDPGSATADSGFRYDNSVAAGGGYVFNLSTKGLLPGAYSLAARIGTDAYIYTLPIQLK